MAPDAGFMAPDAGFIAPGAGCCAPAAAARPRPSTRAGRTLRAADFRMETSRGELASIQPGSVQPVGTKCSRLAPAPGVGPRTRSDNGSRANGHGYPRGLETTRVAGARAPAPGWYCAAGVR